MKDMSQWGESKIIDGFFGTEVTGRFLDIGAYDGVTGSNTWALARRGWSGVCVEANPENFASMVRNLKAFSKVECVCAPVISASESGLQRFYNLEGQCGTLLPKEGSPSYWLMGVTAQQLKMFGEFDFVSVDAEGLDFDILKSLLQVMSPKLICFEDDQPCTRNPEYKKAMLEMLAGYGYTKIVGTTSTDDRSANTLVAKL